MRTLFVTPECAPLTKTGGLGDVSAALPAALRAIGVDARQLLPGYDEVLSGRKDLVELGRLNVLGFDVRLLGAEEIFVIDCPTLYRREGAIAEIARLHAEVGRLVATLPRRHAEGRRLSRETVGAREDRLAVRAGHAHRARAELPRPRLGIGRVAVERRGGRLLGGRL